MKVPTLLNQKYHSDKYYIHLGWSFFEATKYIQLIVWGTNMMILWD
jgi:hypothetical protein